MKYEGQEAARLKTDALRLKLVAHGIVSPLRRILFGTGEEDYPLVWWMLTFSTNLSRSAGVLRPIRHVSSIFRRVVDAVNSAKTCISAGLECSIQPGHSCHPCKRIALEVNICPPDEGIPRESSA